MRLFPLTLGTWRNKMYTFSLQGSAIVGSDWLLRAPLYSTISSCLWLIRKATFLCLRTLQRWSNITWFILLQAWQCGCCLATNTKWNMIMGMLVSCYGYYLTSHKVSCIPRQNSICQPFGSCCSIWNMKLFMPMYRSLSISCRWIKCFAISYTTAIYVHINDCAISFSSWTERWSKVTWE